MARHSPEQLALLKKLLAQKGIRSRTTGSIPRREGTGDAQLSFGQRRLWFLEQLEPGTSLYNDSLALRIRGRALDEQLFDRCLQEVVKRHEVLRTTFPVDGGGPVQRIHPEGEIPMRFVDLSGLADAEHRAEAERLLLEDVRGPFDLEQLPLARATLLRHAKDDHEFGLAIHHIVSDGVSYGTIYREMGALYRAFEAGKPSPLAEEPIQFADFAEWERATITEERISEKLSFWQRELGGRADLELPNDYPRPAEAAHRGAFHRFRFPDSLVRALEEHCRTEQVTSNWVLLAGYFALLHAASGQEDMSIGMPSSMRTRKELEHTIGFFVQTVLLRNDLGGNPSFRELIARTRAKALEISLYEEVPFDRIVQAVRQGRPAPGEAPFIQAWFAHMKDLMPPLRLPGAESSYRIVDPKNARFDLCLILDESGGSIEAYFEYDVDLFSPATIASLAESYTTLLRLVVDHPDTSLSLLRETLAPLSAKDTEGGPGTGAPKRSKKVLKKVRRRAVEG